MSNGAWFIREFTMHLVGSIGFFGFFFITIFFITVISIFLLEKYEKKSSF